jgi:hypothetical protein
MIIDQIKTLLQVLPYPVINAMIDPRNTDNLPCISIAYAAEDMKSISTDQWYDRKTTISIAVVVGESETYYSTVKNITDLVLNTLMTDSVFFSEFKSIEDLSVTYHYGDGGDVNYAMSNITLTLEDNIYFQPVFTHVLANTYLSINDINPFDPHSVANTTLTTGPDGKVEISWPIVMPQ